MEKRARESIQALTQVLDAPLEQAAGITPGELVRRMSSDQAPDVDARAVLADLERRLNAGMHMLWLLTTGKRFTPWRLFTRGPKGLFSDWLSSTEQGIVGLLMLRYFAEESEVAKVRAGYAAEPAADPLPALTTLADACAQLSRELRELVGRR